MACAAPDAVQRARELARLFHEDLDAFARFAPAAPEELPAGPRQLLDHPSHMTVAMERFHGGPVGLVVASSRLGDDGRYAREILLTTPAGRIVWLADRNWCSFPPGRIRWILEVVAILESAAEPDLLPLQVVAEARRIEAIAAVAEAFRWIHATSHDPRQLDALVTALSAQPTSCSSRIRLWHARHQIGLGLRSRYSRFLQQAR